MTLDKIVASIDSEITQLQRARALLSGVGSSRKTPAAVSVRKKHKMSAAGRKRIVAAQRARWAKQKAAA